jgi:uncharacterized membrane protein
MSIRIQSILDELQSSLWFVPTLMVVFAIGLAVGLLQLDTALSPEEIGLEWLAFGGGASAARSILGTIGGSMVGVVGVLFSVTVVALTLAAQQYTPRVLREFTSDRSNQIVFGMFIGTFVYCLMVMRSVRGDGYGDFVPSFAVTGAMILAIVSLGSLIYFIHHVTVSIQVSYLIAQLARETHDSIDRLFPEPVGRDADEVVDANSSSLEPCPGRQMLVRSPRSGYIQTLDHDALLKYAAERGVVVRLEQRIGEFVSQGMPLAVVWPVDGAGGNAGCEDLADCFAIGSVRTMHQDAEYGVRQILDIAVRALSPSMNDPTTAVTAIDYLGSILHHIGNRDIPSPFRKDNRGRLCVIARGANFETMANLAFNEIRQYAEGSVSVIIRVLQVAAKLASTIQNPHRR